jgi:hypothetical protein
VPDSFGGLGGLDDPGHFGGLGGFGDLFCSSPVITSGFHDSRDYEFWDHSYQNSIRLSRRECADVASANLPFHYTSVKLHRIYQQVCRVAALGASPTSG